MQGPIKFLIDSDNFDIIKKIYILYLQINIFISIILSFIHIISFNNINKILSLSIHNYFEKIIKSINANSILLARLGIYLIKNAITCPGPCQ